MSTEIMTDRLVPPNARTRPVQPVRLGYVLTAVAAASFLLPLAVTAPAIGLADYARSLHAGATATQWVQDGYNAMFAATVLIAGSAADKFGRRRLLAGGITVFGLSSLVIATLSAPLLIVVLRISQGVGAGGILAAGGALLASIAVGRSRTTAFGVLGASFGTGLALGPVLAGALNGFGWRASYVLIAVVALMSLVGVLRFAPNTTGDSTRRLDVAGMLTFATAVMALSLALVVGPDWGWGSWATLAVFAVTAVSGVAFVRTELRIAHPLFDVRMLRNREFTTIMCEPFTITFGFVILLVYLPVYLESTSGVGALVAATSLLLLTVPVMLIPPAAGLLVRHATIKTVLVTGSVCIALGAVLIAIGLRPHGAEATIWPGLLVFGVGVGLAFAVMDNAAITSVATEQAGTASGMFNTVRITGESVAISGAGALLLMLTRSGAPGSAGVPDHVAARALQGLAAISASGDQPDYENFEAWSTLAAWSEQTSNVEIGTLVTGVGYRNPDLLADMARTVDHISDGRLILGVGAGWYEADYRRYGYEFGTVASRMAHFGDCLERIRHRLDVLVPAPRCTIPILIGGGGERKTLPLVARYGDIWHYFDTPETLAHKNAVLDRHAVANGRDPQTILRSQEWVNEDIADTYARAGCRCSPSSSGRRTTSSSSGSRFVGATAGTTSTGNSQRDRHGRAPDAQYPQPGTSSPGVTTTQEDNMSSKIWFITGATSGFGRSLTEAVLDHGDVVVAAVRRPAALADLAGRYPDTLDVLALDVADTAAAQASVERALDTRGRIDVLVNNAGKGLIGAAEEVGEQELRDLCDLHLHGPVALTKAVLPSMRARGQGLIVQLSSNAGRTSFRGVSAYSATKFALEGWSEALYHEVLPFGVHVVIVEPGAFRTRFHGSSLEYPAVQLAEYEPVLAEVKSMLAGYDGQQPGDPVKAADVLVELADHPEPPLRLVLGSDSVEVVGDALRAQLSDMDSWDKISRSTDF